MSAYDNAITRLKWRGGFENGLNVKAKYRSFLSALKNSYQSEIVGIPEEDEAGQITYKEWQCLINPDKIKESYDQKIISIDFDSGIKEGDTFLWTRTNSHWIVYLQDLCEEAYFRGNIRRCNAEIEVKGKNYWVYLRGPEETTEQWNQKHNIVYNLLNYSLLIYITKNDDTNEFFQRNRKVRFLDHNWQVVAVDRYSQNSILEVYLDEDFENSLAPNEDITEDTTSSTEVGAIEGLTKVNPFDTSLVYTVDLTGGTFSIDEEYKEIAEITSQDESSCKINILTGKTGTFVLSYNMTDEESGESVASTLTINVQSF